MKKALLGTLAAAAFATTAHAGSLSADFRADYDSTSYNTDASNTSTTLTGNTKLKFQTARIDYKGQAGDDLTYRIRVRLDKAKSLQTRDNTDGALDFAYITNKFNDMFSLTMGKFATEMGGFEGNTAGPEMYLNSTSYSGTSYLTGASSSTQLKGILLYSTGVQATVALGDNHQIHVQAFNEEGNVGLGYGSNGDDASGASSAYAQQNNLLGLVYKGAFMDKTLNALVSYHTEQVGASDNKINFTTVGLEYVWNNLTTQFDYDMNRFQQFGATTPKQSLDQIVLNFKYKMDKFTPIVKFATATEKLDKGTSNAFTADIKNTYTDFGAALEYTPNKDQNFRYHIAYNNRTMTPDSSLSASNTRNLQEVIVGTRILADFLK